MDGLCDQHAEMVRAIMDLHRQIAETRSLLVRVIIGSSSFTATLLSIVVALTGV